MSDWRDEEWLPLRVTHAESVADGMRLFELRAAEGGALPRFAAGAHIPVRTPHGGTRNYSLCNDPAETDRYVIAVKREEQGRGGSISMVDKVRPGDELLVGPPANLFELTLSAPSYIFVAGGIGITPIMAMLRAVARRSEASFHLYYLTRSPETTAFLPEISRLVADGKATLHHDHGRPEDAFDLWPILERPTPGHVYCCGPRGLMGAVRDMTGHWPSSQIHFEDFGSDLVRPRQDDRPFRVQLGPVGPRLDVPVGATILEVLRAHGRRAPSSCEGGTCGTCRTRVLDGEPDHRDLVLTESERRTQMMICVSRATSDLLVLDL